MFNDAYWMAVNHIASLDKRFKLNRLVGWVYAFKNAHYVPTMYKIGETSRPPHLRLKELSSQTGVPFDFEAAYFVHVQDRRQAERWVHQELEEYRVSTTNEFFAAPFELVKQTLDHVASELPTIAGKGKRTMYLPQPFQSNVPEPKLSHTIECIGCLTENRIPDPKTIQRATCGKCGLVLPVASLSS